MPTLPRTPTTTTRSTTSSLRSLLAIAVLGAGLGAIGLGVAGNAGCTQPRSTRCRTTCAREAECLEEISKETDTSFDEKECLAACGSLETDQQTRPIVEEHAACVGKASSCTAVQACK